MRASRIRAAVATATLAVLVPTAFAVAAPLASQHHASAQTASTAWADPAGVLHGAPIHGMILSAFDQSPTPAIPDLPRLKALGVNTVSAYIYLYQASMSASDVEVSPLTSSDTELQALTTAAHALGMAVEFVPVISVGLTPPTPWRGLIQPANISEWFRSYNLVITHYTNLAQTLHVELFCIGSELDSLQYRSYNWSQMAAWVHRHYSGLRTYMPSGSGVFHLDWAGSLDLISVSPYYSLSNNATNTSPTVGELVSVWKRGWLPKLAAVAAKFHRPIVFAEIGYCSVVGATAHPSYAYSNHLGVSEQAQANAYWALLQATQGASWLRGIIWWHWDAPRAAPVDRDFSPRDKTAECVIARWWSPGSLGVPTQVSRVPDVCLADHLTAAA